MVNLRWKRRKKDRWNSNDFRQQQQLERVKKWLQLRNRDIDHRTQVEERRKKREEEAKVEFLFFSLSPWQILICCVFFPEG